MKFYTELTLISNAEIGPYRLWSKLYMQLHLAMVELKNKEGQCPIGVFFPEYSLWQENSKILSMLGSKVRLFANDEAGLQGLNLPKWLERLTDNVHIKSVQPVPKNTGLAIVNRYRPKPNKEKMTRRCARRKGIMDLNQAKATQVAEYARRHCLSEEQALEHYVQPREYKNFPFIKMKSLHSDHDFSLMIEQNSVHKTQEGLFSTYGLSSTSTVPNW